MFEGIIVANWMAGLFPLSALGRAGVSCDKCFQYLVDRRPKRCDLRSLRRPLESVVQGWWLGEPDWLEDLLLSSQFDRRT